MAAIENASERAAAIDAYKRRYLSEKARDAPAARCPMVALGTDVSRQHGPVLHAYAAGLRRYLDAFTRALARRQAVAPESRAAASDRDAGDARRRAVARAQRR